VHEKRGKNPGNQELPMLMQEAIPTMKRGIENNQEFAETGLC
jgi:hypothetical protein